MGSGPPRCGRPLLAAHAAATAAAAPKRRLRPRLPTPTAVPTAPPANVFVAGDWIISPKVYNEFSPGNVGNMKKDGMSYRIRGAYEFNIFNLPWMIEGDFRNYRYPHNANRGYGSHRCEWSVPGCTM